MFNSLMSMRVSMLNDKQTAFAVVFALVAVLMISASTRAFAESRENVIWAKESKIYCKSKRIR
ncbi:MAG: hypothetical protein WA667_08430 [Candidatus Nitrosopolaris sp.]